MKKEDLFRAIGDVGDDLIHMAEHKRFPNYWKKWVPMAACMALIVGLGAMALPYFPMGCGSKSAAPEAAPEEPKYSMDVVDQESKTEEAETPEAPMEEPMEAEPEAEEEAAPMVPGADGTAEDSMNGTQEGTEPSDVTQITICSTVYYLRPGIVKEGATPGNLGQYIGEVETSDNEAYIGCPVYEMAHTVWYSNHAVDGQSVPAEILVEGPDGWIAGFTGNEKTVSRYTAADVQAAIDQGDDEWIIRTFVQPIQAQEIYLLYEIGCEDSENLNRLFLASLYLNTGTAIDIAWADGDGLLVHPRDVEQRLEKFLDGFTYDPTETEAYNPKTGMLQFTSEERYRYAEGLYLKFAGLEDDLLYLRVGLPETDDLYDEVGYKIRFDADSWRYLSIETPG